MELLFAFLAAHAVCDFVLQGDVMGRGKSRRRHRKGEFDVGFPPWYYWLSAHGLTHGGAVYLISGMWTLGAVETVLHAIIDHQKCEDRISLNVDQALHLGCKLVYVFVLL